MFRSRAVSLALVGLFVWLTGCTTWQPIAISELPEHDYVRVTSVSVGSTEIRDPRVEADSIKGDWQGAGYAIPVAGVRSVEARLPDTGATITAAALVILLAAGFWVMVSCTDTGSFGGIEWTC